MHFTDQDHNSTFNHIVLRYDLMVTASIVSAIHKNDTLLSSGATSADVQLLNWDNRQQKLSTVWLRWWLSTYVFLNEVHCDVVVVGWVFIHKSCQLSFKHSFQLNHERKFVKCLTLYISTVQLFSAIIQN